MLRASGLQAIPGVVHVFTTREGGCSAGPLRSLNLGSRVGDDRANVQRNRATVLAAMGRDDATWVCLRQVHGATVVEVTHQASALIEADGMLTRDPEAALAVLVADCVPILMADLDGSVIAAVHAGWRGTRAGIARAMVDRLSGLGIAPERVRVALGPAIGPCCFEIGADVAEELCGTFEGAREHVRREGEGERWVANLWQLNRALLSRAGVRDEHIEVLERCTSCTPSLYSHRRDHAATGRQAGVIAFARR